MSKRPYRRLAAAAAVGALSFLPARSPAEPTAPTTDATARLPPLDSVAAALAERLLALERGGRSDTELAGVGVALATPLLGPPNPALVAAYQRAITEDRDDLNALRQREAETYARVYTAEELRALIAFLESPLGERIHRKRLDAVPGRPELTPDEAQAERVFEESPVGRSVMEKRQQARLAVVFATADIRDRIARRAIEHYCREAACPPVEPGGRIP